MSAQSWALNYCRFFRIRNNIRLTETIDSPRFLFTYLLLMSAQDGILRGICCKDIMKQYFTRRDSIHARKGSKSPTFTKVFDLDLNLNFAIQVTYPGENRGDEVSLMLKNCG